MKTKIFKTFLIIAVITIAYFVGKSNCNYDYKNYIKCDTFDTYEIEGNELHIIANDGNEYVFEK